MDEIGILPNLISVNDCDDLCLKALTLGQIGRSNLERPSYMGIVFLTEPFVQANAVEGRIRRDWLSRGYCKCEAEREPGGTQHHTKSLAAPWPCLAPWLRKMRAILWHELAVEAGEA